MLCFYFSSYLSTVSMSVFVNPYSSETISFMGCKNSRAGNYVATSNKISLSNLVATSTGNCDDFNAEADKDKQSNEDEYPYSISGDSLIIESNDRDAKMECKAEGDAALLTFKRK